MKISETKEDLKRTIKELNEIVDRYKSGYQGSCYACEPVGILNQQLRAENSRLHHQTNKLGEDVLRLRAEVAECKKDAERLAWWFDFDSHKPSSFMATYLQGMQERWSLDKWRVAIDAALGGEGKDETA